MIILATTGARDAYRRDFLTCLASPENQLASFSYRTRWIQPDLLEDPTRLEDVPALIVFGDQASDAETEFDFVALRRVQLRGLLPEEVVRRRLYDGETKLTLEFQLGRYVSAAPNEVKALRRQWTDQLRALPRRPLPDSESSDALFVFELGGDLPESDGMQEGTAWQTLARELATCRSLSESYFFRVAELRGKKGPAGLHRGDSATGRLRYLLTTKQQYTLQLDAYNKAGDEPADAVETMVTSDRLIAENPESLAQGEGQGVQVRLTAGPVQVPTATTLVIRGKGPLEAHAPRVQVPMLVRPDMPLTVLLILVIAAGAVIAGLSKDELGVSTGVAIGGKVLGGLMVSGGLYQAGRRAVGVTG